MHSSIILGAIGKYGVYDGPDYLGVEGDIDDVNYRATGLNKQRYSAERVRCKLVRNASGGALAPGKLVIWSTDSTYGPGKAVGVVTAGVVAGVAGVVDPALPAAGVPDGETFILIVEGPTWICYDGSANYAIGDDFVSTSSGRTIEYITGTHDQGARLGKILEAKSSGSADDKVRARLKFLG